MLVRAAGIAVLVAATLTAVLAVPALGAAAATIEGNVALPAAAPVPVRPKRRPAWGAFAGAIELAPDFNAPGPDIERDFEGR